MEYTVYIIRKDGSEVPNTSNLREYELPQAVDHAMRKVWENPDILKGFKVLRTRI